MKDQATIDEAVRKLIIRKDHWAKESDRAASEGDDRPALIYSSRGWALHEAIEIIRGERTTDGSYIGTRPDPTPPIPEVRLPFGEEWLIMMPDGREYYLISDPSGGPPRLELVRVVVTDGAVEIEGSGFDEVIGEGRVEIVVPTEGSPLDCETCGDRPAKRTLLLKSKISETEEKTFSTNCCVPCRDALYGMSKDDWVQTWVLDEKLYEGPEPE